jgi:putative transposase
MIYKLVDQWQQKAAVTQACRVLNVSRAGYYAAKKRIKTLAVCTTTVHLKAAFNASQRSYGSRRLMSTLQGQNIKIGRYKVRRLMREADLKPVWK